MTVNYLRMTLARQAEAGYFHFESWMQVSAIASCEP